MIGSPAMGALLALIRKYEAPAGYNQRFAEAVPKRDLSKMTFDEVIEYGRQRVTVDKKQSSAIGAYQFITKTLRALRNNIKFNGKELFTPALQDELAMMLMEGRGLSSYLQGNLTAETFANNLAKEWASLPVVTPIQGASRMLKPGQSYYAGDGLNAAHHKPEVILAAVKALKDPVVVNIPPKPPQEIPVQPPVIPVQPPTIPPPPDVDPMPPPPYVTPDELANSKWGMVIVAVAVVAVIVFLFIMKGYH